MDDAAFLATYSDWKVIKGRKVVQIVLEKSLESSDEAYRVLGGMPNPAAEVWVGVSAVDPTKIGLHTGGTGEQRDDSLKSGRHALTSETNSTEGSAELPTKTRRSLSQHGFKLLCTGPLGWNFINHHRNRIFVSEYQGPIDTPDRAKGVLKDWIGCKQSLSEVERDAKLAGVLDNILGLFEGWKRGYDKA